MVNCAHQPNGDAVELPASASGITDRLLPSSSERINLIDEEENRPSGSCLRKHGTNIFRGCSNPAREQSRSRNAFEIEPEFAGGRSPEKGFAATGTNAGFCPDLVRNIRKNKNTHTIGVRPKNKIHTAVSAGEPLLALRTGSHTRKNSRPRGASVATPNSEGFFRMAGALRKRPRKRPISTNAASHSTGVLKNHLEAGAPLGHQLVSTLTGILPRMPSGFCKSCRGPAPNPSIETENEVTLTLLMIALSYHSSGTDLDRAPLAHYNVCEQDGCDGKSGDPHAMYLVPDPMYPLAIGNSF